MAMGLSTVLTCIICFHRFWVAAARSMPRARASTSARSRSSAIDWLRRPGDSSFRNSSAITNMTMPA